ncbi:hypothetical protein SAMN05421788_108232 [Filimonas lacunae]|uniref:Uncharacterized protein n=1 Tax=Filimonas lacunae TaxID=477680 RepID=A0A173MDF3_9BACT|nr:hypothetical protein FLA_1633 [Filimonas lacunae]SIT29157.1 hypothetical protein SAMN05421788_108232 [Filimonas lacunae]
MMAGVYLASVILYKSCIFSHSQAGSSRLLDELLQAEVVSEHNNSLR